MEEPVPTAALNVFTCECPELHVPMGLELLGIIYNKSSETCTGLLIVFKCSVALAICYIADTDLEILVHRPLVNYVLLIIQEKAFIAPQDCINLEGNSRGHWVEPLAQAESYRAD